jgi:hypothetical protein
MPAATEPITTIVVIVGAFVITYLVNRWLARR